MEFLLECFEFLYCREESQLAEMIYLIFSSKINEDMKLVTLKWAPMKMTLHDNFTVKVVVKFIIVLVL